MRAGTTGIAIGRTHISVLSSTLSPTRPIRRDSGTGHRFCASLRGVGVVRLAAHGRQAMRFRRAAPATGGAALDVAGARIGILAASSGYTTGTIRRHFRVCRYG